MPQCLTLGAGRNQRVVGNDVGGAALAAHLVKQLQAGRHRQAQAFGRVWWRCRAHAGWGACDHSARQHKRRRH